MAMERVRALIPGYHAAMVANDVDAKYHRRAQEIHRSMLEENARIAAAQRLLSSQVCALPRVHQVATCSHPFMGFVQISSSSLSPQAKAEKELALMRRALENQRLAQMQQHKVRPDDTVFLEVGGGGSMLFRDSPICLASLCTIVVFSFANDLALLSPCPIARAALRGACRRVAAPCRPAALCPDGACPPLERNSRRCRCLYKHFARAPHTSLGSCPRARARGAPRPRRQGGPLAAGCCVLANHPTRNWNPPTR